MSRIWEVGPRKERWELVQAAVDDVRGNRTTNGSDDGVHHTGCVAPKNQQSPSATQATTDASQATDEDFSAFRG